MFFQLLSMTICCGISDGISGWYFRGESEPRPNWCEFMQDVTSGSHLPASDIRLLPMIDMNPSDRSCILSTLLFIID